MMSMHRLTAGAGYQYLLRHTASGDTDRPGAGGLAGYYAQSGNPPGRWIGAGLPGLDAGAGLTPGAVVTEEAMAHLFGNGHDPVSGVPLGRAYPTFTPAAERIASAVAKLPAGMGVLQRQTAIDTITEGTVMNTEFQNPGANPVQFNPVQAADQALIHASKVGRSVGTKILPSRIWSRSFSDVMIIT